MSERPNRTRIQTLPDLLRHAAEGEGEVIFVQGADAERRMPYRELLAEATGLLARFQAHGLEPGERVVLQLADERRFLTAFWAVLLGGAVPVPVHAGNQPDHLAKLRAILARIPNARLAADPARLAALGELKIAVARPLPVDEEGVGPAPPGPRCAEPAPEDLAFVQFSSGSTGTPKGVMLAHRNLFVNIRAIARRSSTDARDRFLSWMPLTHDMGLILNHLVPLAAGATLILMPTPLFVRRPLLWLAKAGEHAATELSSPNFGLSYAVAASERAGGAPQLDLRSVRLLWNGAEPISARVARRFCATFAGAGFAPDAMLPCYGLAEATVGVSAAPPGGPMSVKRIAREGLAVGAPIRATEGAEGLEVVALGPPFDDVEVAIADDDGAHLPERHQGHVLIRGASVTSGYLDDPEETAVRRRPGGWFDTGDLGFVDGGAVTITGRAKDLIIVGGANYYPHDLENALAELAGIGANGVAACAVGGDEGEEVAVFVRYHGQDAEFAPLAAAVRGRIAERFGLAVRHVVPVRRIPKTTSGKLQRFALARAFAAGELAEPRPAPPPAAPPDLARIVRAEAEAVLGRPLEPERPLAEQGLSSLLAVELARRFSERLGRRLPATLAYDAPTLTAIAGALAGDAERAAAPGASDPEEPIAVVGIGLRLPGGLDDAEALWSYLLAGGDAIEPLPPERREHDTDYPGGFLRDIDAFDAAAFGISAAEARHVDPQQRLLLETAWRALDDAGVDHAAWHGAPIGVFVGIANVDYARRGIGGADPERIVPYGVTGTAPSVAAGRIAYAFGFEGPALAVDTACSSSLVATHLALGSLRRGECAAALAAGVNLILDPALHAGFTQLGALAGDGRCKAFDAAADGYGRSEGCVVVVLKRLRDAQAAQDRIYALIRGSALNHDGASNGLTAPSGPAQRAVMRAALTSAGLRPDEIGYVEAHGSGTPLGDAQEAASLAAVYGGERPAPVLVGSVKTNLGHTEAAAGLTGLVKAALVVQRGAVPPHLHLKTPNPHVPWEAVALAIPTTTTPWNAGGMPRRAAVSSFGLSGTNAHLILEQPPEADGSGPEPALAPPYLLPLSARSPAALNALRAAWDAQLAETAAGALPALVATAARRRTHHAYRLAVSGRDAAELRTGLAAAPPPVRARTAPRIVFVVPGQGGQWPGMARDLLEEDAAFRAAFASAAEAIARESGCDPLALLRTGDAAALAPVDVLQPLLFAVTLGLAAAWEALGIVPDGVIGHSMGEVAAAYLCGALSLDDAAAVICRRSRLMRRLGGGAMLAVALDPAAARAAAAGEPNVAIAAENSPESTVLSGPAPAIERLASALTARGIEARPVAVDVASHGPAVDPIRADLIAALAGLAPRPVRIPLWSSVTGSAVAGTELDAGYWAENLRRTVRFSTAALAAEGDVFVELSPHPVLTLPLEATYAAAGREASAVGSLRREAPGRRALFESLGRLYERGAAVAWERIVPLPPRPAALPAYPFQRERAWLEPARGAASPGWPGRAREIAGERLALWEATLDIEALPALGDHRVGEEVVVPAAAWIILVLTASGRDEIERIRFHEPVVLGSERPVALELKLHGGTFALHSRDGGGWRLVASGTLGAPRAEDGVPPTGETLLELDGEAVYAALAARGLAYGPAFRGLRAVTVGTDGTRAEIALAECGAATAIARLDAAFHAAARLPLTAAAPVLPVAVEGLRLRRGLPERFTVRTAECPGAAAGGERTVALHAQDADGEVLRIDGLTLAPLAGPDAIRFDHVTAWEPVPPSEGVPPTERAVYVVTPDGALAEERELGDVVRTVDAFVAWLRRADADGRAVTLIAGADGPVEAALRAVLRTAAAEGFARDAVAVELVAPSDAGAAELARGLDRPGEFRLVGGAMFAPRLVPLASPAAPAPPALPPASYRAVVSPPGGIAFRARPVPVAPPQRVVLEIAAVGLNFINVLSALGTYPGVPGGMRSLGIEAAGTVVACGEGVEGLRPGDRVAGIVEDALARHAVADPRLLVPLEGLADEDAAALPIAYLTAALALEEHGRLRAGDTVLIHTAAGGVGQAAIALARRLGVRVIATAGSEEKRARLRAQDIAAVFDSRSARFVGDVLAATAGRGVDCVLNTLAGPLLDAGLCTLAPGGRFVELGKADVYGVASIPLARLREGRSFLTLDLDALLRDRPAELGARLAGLVRDVEAGRLPALPVRTRPFSEAGAALDDLAAAGHVGKIVVTRRLGDPPVDATREPAIRNDATYLLTGGYGALGIALAGFLVAQGARSLVLTGRGAPGAAANASIARWRAEGSTITLAAVDANDADATARLLDRIDRTLPPLAGIVHAAGILDDVPLAALDGDALARVFAPKLGGALHLHALTLDRRLDFFVALSSLAAHVGSPGQAAYAAANAAVEALVRARRDAGLPGTALALGPVAAGLAVADASRRRNVATSGWPLLAVDDVVAAFARALDHVEPVVIVVDAEHADVADPLLAGRRTVPQPALDLPAGDERLTHLERLLAEELGRVLRSAAARLDREAPFRELGLDSLMAMQVRSRLNAALGLSLSVASFWRHPSIAQYARHVDERLGAAS